jgi:TonB-linked SusC/RagA family outer membrane protein
VSLGYTNEQGLIQSSGYKRYSGRFNVEQTIKPWFKVGANTSFSRAEEDLVDDAVFRVARGANPLLPYVDSLYLAWGNNWDINSENPVKSLTIDKDRVKNRFFNATYVNLTPAKNWNIRSTFTVDATDQQYYEYVPSNIQQAKRDSYRGRAVHNLDNAFNYQWDNSVTYDLQIGNHGFTFIGGTSFMSNQYKYTNVSARDFPTDDFSYYNLGAAFDKENFGLGSNDVHSSILSFFGRVNYEYDNRYFVKFTTRFDGSSKFADGHRWGVFPSAEVAWNVLGEQFMSDQNIFDQAKVRVSYGSVGNQAIPDYAFYSLYNPVYSDGSVSFNSSGLRGTPNLTWEKQDQLNAGVDFRFLNGRISFTMDYFHTVNSNLLMRRSLSALTGYREAIENVGEMTNRGVEFSINATILDHDDFTWSAGLNLSADKNKITKLYGDVDAIYALGGFSGTDIQREGNYFLGESINTIYTYEFDRIIQESDMEYVNSLTLPGKTLQPGDILPKDQQKPGEDGYGVIDEKDRVIVGKKDPKFYGGFTTQFGWKGISLNAIFTYRYGAKAISYYYESLMNGTGYSAAHKDMLDRWTPENTDTNIPRATYDASVRFGPGDTSWGVQDASFLRLATLTVAYDFPKSLVGRAHVNDLRLYVSGNNLATWSKYKGYDAENGDNYPTARMYVVGLNLSF